MQDIQSIEREREGGGGGADRRLRPLHHQNRQALKCPRCDSLNTKFCYYNNYNQSQPRHFCKTCRRYWTDGGVLRSVPIGGGCRKTKRSKPKHKQTTSATDAATTIATPSLLPQVQQHQHNHQQQQRQREQLKSSNSHSSSESSSLTATNTAKASTAVEAASDYNSSNNTNNTDNILNGIGESKLFSHADSSLNPSMEAGLQQAEQRSSDCVTFSEIENFTNLIDSSNEQLHFGFSNLLNQQGLDQGHGQDQDQLWQHQKMGHGMGWSNGEEMMKMQDVFGRGGGGGLIDDQTMQVEYSRFGGLDWQGAGDHGLFDLHTAVDQVYWSSQNQWTDQDHSSLYLP